MARKLRYIPDDTLVEITTRTVQGRFLLKPGPGWREVFVGALARARELYEVDIHDFVCLSTHLHLLVSPKSAQHLARFMRHFLSKLSKEAAKRHGWSGPLFQRRYQAILVSGETQAQVGRLRYLLSHGVKENLVRSVREWPGPHSGPVWLAGGRAEGVWHDRTRAWVLRKRGEEVRPEEVSVRNELELTPLPCWSHLSADEYRARVGELLRDVEEDASRRRRVEGLPVLGARRVLDQDPQATPLRTKRSPAPFCHAAQRFVRHEMWKAYVRFCLAYREAADRLGQGVRDVVFPPGSFPPAMPYALPAAEGVP
jgi:REP element-mobilizing transposase RayT